jgi:hypothetical protein
MATVRVFEDITAAICMYRSSAFVITKVKVSLSSGIRGVAPFKASSQKYK